MPLVKKNNFEDLIHSLFHVHAVLQGYASKFINQFLSLRSWLFGHYMVEYEQNGEDRAKYGENLIANIAQKAKHIKGLTGHQLYVCRNFYLLYPHFLRTVSVILQSQDTGHDEILRTQSVKSQIIDTENISNKGIIQKIEEINDDLRLSPELLLSRLSFSHFIELIRVDDSLQRLFYEVEAIKNNWSVRDLKRAIGTSLAFRTVMSTNKEAVIAKIKNLKPITNAEVIRNPYVLEFLDLDEKPEYSESDLEQQILTHLQEFLIELGTGFCFEARQKRITFDNEHYRIDLVFYHKSLKCNVLIDLKLRAYRYADAGQMNLFLNYYKENEMTEGDNPPIGIILCSDRSDTLVKYSTAGMDDHLFVSQYLVKLPDKKVLENFMKKELNQ
jgi:predicted nuclease of restriction endonuclease-like (RecB) superfamily